MPKEFKRTDRIAEHLMRSLSTLIQQEVKDPRLPKLVTVTAVNVSNDLSLAKVYITSFGSNEKEVESILNGASGYLRTRLANTSKLRTMPKLHFVYDTSIEYAKHLTRVIDEVNQDNSDLGDSGEESH